MASLGLYCAAITSTILLGYGILLISTPSSFATEPPSIIISEVYAAPSGTESEWIELLNLSGTAMNISGYRLSDELSAPTTLHVFSHDTALIQPCQTLVITLTGSKLNNSADGITLHDPDGYQADRVTYANAVTGISFQRQSTELPSMVSNSPSPGQAEEQHALCAALPSPSETPTPPDGSSPTPMPTVLSSPAPTPSPTGQPTPSATPMPHPSPAPTLSPTAHLTPTPTPTPDTAVLDSAAITAIDDGALTITEVLSCPADGQPEWIEFHNQSGVSLQLSNWRITDTSGNYRVMSGVIPSNSFVVLHWAGSLLNNTGDSFTLATSRGQPVYSATVPSCTPGTSFYFSNNEWLSGNPTPGESAASASITTTPTPTPSAVLSVQQPADNRTFPATKSAATSASATGTNLPADKLPAGTTVSSALPPFHLPQVLGARTSPTSTETSPRPHVLISDMREQLPNRPWGHIFVIMAGMLFILAGGIPSHGQKKPDIQTAASLAPSPPMGWNDFSVQCAAGIAQSG